MKCRCLFYVSVQLITATPELSQRLFGLTKSITSAPAAPILVLETATTTAPPSLTISAQLQAHNQPQSESSAQLPTLIGLKVRQMQADSRNSNSLLKQQLRSGLKDIEIMQNSSAQTQSQEKTSSHGLTQSSLRSSIDACSALQSLATVAAERQAPSSIQPPSANNLQHQFLLHMAANPLHKTASNDYYQQQRAQEQDQEQLQHFKSEPQQLAQQQEEEEEEQQLQLQISEREENMSPPNLDIILDQNDKSDPELTLADESAGLDYKSSENNSLNDSGKLPTVATAASADGDGSNVGSPVNHRRCRNSGDGPKHRPVQRRRARRKAQSTVDDQAEHLTEMSVRGLDLFRYASITEGVYQCTECAKENLQKTFKNKYSFQRHAFLYHEGKHRKVFPCPLCGKEFSRPDKMKNHLKMTHESFVAKDMSNFSPLNYLITAAAAGEIFTQQQQQHQHTSQSSLQADGSMTQDELGAGMNLLQAGHEQSPPHSPADALLKLHNDIVIKNEISISPSPSPPPAQSELTVTAVQAVRLEEVK